jgi:hypothetical protein
MNLKNGFVLFLFSAFLLGMVSCLGNGETYDEITLTDAQLTSFSLSHDSIPALAKTKFSINQVEGIIFNYDSLPYRTVLTDSLLKITYTTGSGISQSLQLKATAADGSDSIYWKASADSIRLINNELAFTVFAPDSTNGKKKEYLLKVNIHQINPDSIQYAKLNAVESYPQIEKPWIDSISHITQAVVPLGFLHPDKTNLDDKDLAMIVSDGATDYFKLYRKETPWIDEGKETPSDFPRSEFSTINQSSLFADRLTIINNLHSVWATEDGLYWANLSNTTDSLPTIKGGIAFHYNNEIWFMGGSVLDKSGNIKEDNYTAYYSQDGGIVWKARDSSADAPIAFNISNTAIVLDKNDPKNQYFYIIKDTGTGKEVWKAFINSKLFDH